MLIVSVDVVLTVAIASMLLCSYPASCFFSASSAIFAAAAAIASATASATSASQQLKLSLLLAVAVAAAVAAAADFPSTGYIQDKEGDSPGPAATSSSPASGNTLRYLDQ